MIWRTCSSVKRAAEGEAPRGHLGSGDTAGDEAADLVVGGRLQELLGVEHGAAAADGVLAVASRAVGREELGADLSVRGLLRGRRVLAELRLARGTR